MSFNSPFDISGVALITGGGSGIGKATSLLLAKEGVRGLVIADLSLEAAGAVKDEAATVAAMVDSVVSTFGRLDYAVNCAGIGLKKALNDTSEDEWHRVIGLNLNAVFRCVKAESAEILKQTPMTSERAYQPLQRGAIVNIASLSPMVGLRLSGAYTASKHGVLGLTHTSALDYPDVKINCIVPGYIETLLTNAPGLMRENALDKVNNWTPVNRFWQPAEIAEGIVWLLSSRSNFVHGSALSMDGGYLAH